MQARHITTSALALGLLMAGTAWAATQDKKSEHQPITQK